MSGVLADVVGAELVKLRGLRAVVAAAVGTVVGAVALAAAVAGTTAGAGSGTDGADGVVPAVAWTVPFLQVGTVLLGALAAGTEYDGHQVRTTLTATPRRGVLLLAKGLALLGVLGATGVVAVLAALATGGAVGAVRDVPTPAPDGVEVAGAAAYLVLLGLLAFAVGVVVRSVVGALATTLAVVLVASPLLASVSEHARWLPDRAGTLLYLPDGDPVLTRATGALVLVGWATLATAAASVALTRRDA